MADYGNNADEKIKNFFRAALKFYGKDVGLMTNQHFSISQLRDLEKEEEGEFSYVIQYGFPQSGAVILYFRYLQKENEMALDKISVYAQPEGEQVMMANFAPRMQEGPVSVRLNFGMDMGTKEHTSIKEIEENPNALKMLDVAIAELRRGQILGECSEFAPAGSDEIPCCSSSYISNNRGRGM